MLFDSQEERRASDSVLFTSENNDIANQSVNTWFFTSEKNRMTNQLASLARRDYFYLDALWRVNLGMYIIIQFTGSPDAFNNMISGAHCEGTNHKCKVKIVKQGNGCLLFDHALARSGSKQVAEWPSEDCALLL